MPHGHCYLWTPSLLWTFVVSEGLIALSYFSIPVGIIYYVEKREDIDFNWMFILFSLFIFSCGITHLIGIWTIWQPDYWMDAAFKAVTAAISFVTAVMLWPLIPKLLKMPSHKQLEHVVVQLQAFAYSVSHDLRGPLRGIDGWSLALLEDYADRIDETGRGYLQTIRTETQRMGQLIDDLLQFSRTNRLEMKQATVDLSTLAQTVADRLRQGEGARQIEFAIQSGLSAVGDGNLLEIVLTNLLGNAVKFTKHCAVAKIEFGNELDQDQDTKALRPVFFVRDNGVGFDMAHAKRLFGVFQRLHTASEFAGTGVGLATVQRIVHRHAGKVWADARIGQGATFYFTLGETA